MKGTFDASIELLKIEETLKDKQPYAILTVSTTGIDNKSFSGNMPIRANLIEYNYDETTGTYKEAITFDKMVDCGPDALKHALDTKDSYNVFINGDINEQDYIDKKNVLSIEEFKKNFDYTIDSIKKENAVLIINGEKAAISALSKIDCAEKINDIKKENKVLDQINITSEYFNKKNIFGSKTLEALNNYIHPVSSKASFYKDAEKIKDFSELSKEDFLNKHKNITEKYYDFVLNEKIKRESKIIGGINRINVINDFITKYGQENHFLDNDYITYLKKSNIEYTEALSQKGKKNYENKNMENKLNFLASKNIINSELIENHEDSYHKLMDALSGKNGNKGVILLHSATTGFNKDPKNKGKLMPKETGYPIQFTAIVYPIVDNILDMRSSDGISFNISAPKNEISKAEAKRNSFDVFADAGINLDEYKEGKNVFTIEDSVKTINDFFTKYPIKDYKLITLGNNFVQTSMQNIGNFSFCTEEGIDLAQAIKDYCYITQTDKKYTENVLLPADKSENIKTFKLADIANANNVDITGTLKKCNFMSKITYKLSKQYSIMFEPEKAEHFKQLLQDYQQQKLENNNKDKEEQKSQSTENSLESKDIEKLKNIDDIDNKMPDFLDEDAYDDDYDDNEENYDYDEENYDYDENELSEENEENQISPSEYSESLNVKETPESESELPNRKELYKASSEMLLHNKDSFSHTPSISPNNNDDLIAAINNLTAIVSTQNEIIMSQKELIEKQINILSNQNTELLNQLNSQTEFFKQIIMENNLTVPERLIDEKKIDKNKAIRQ